MRPLAARARVPAVASAFWGPLLLGCTSAPPEPPLPPPPPPASAVGMPSPPPPIAKRRFAVSSRPAPDLDDDAGPAPCDFARSYRGLVDKKTPVTLALRAKGDALEGLGHYDLAAPALPLQGARKGTSFVLREKGGGTFEGTCDAKGALRGELALGKKRQPFELSPRPAARPGLYRVTRRATAEPAHPKCVAAAKPKTIVTLDVDGMEVFCLPTDPKERRRVTEEAPHLLCSASHSGPRLFGLPDASIEKKANAALAATGFEIAVKDLSPCTGRHSSSESQGVVVASEELLVVRAFRSEDLGGVHPMNFGGASRAVDLTTGSSISLDDLVDVKRLRDTASACLSQARFGSSAKDTFEISGALPPPRTCAQDADGPGRFLWGCTPDDLSEPAWMLLPEGLVIGAWANPHVSAYEDGQGPILPWSVLLRDGVLRADSRHARLWAGVPKAGPSALSCGGEYLGSTIVTWRELPG